MMIDSHSRKIDYLRISLTERCNLRCRYCMPEEGVEDVGHNRVLTLEQIFRLVRAATQVGFHKVRLTGGEPLVRKNIVKLIADIAGLPEIDDISITTNGILFADMAEDLKSAGLKRVNFSLDSLVSEKVSYITRGGQLADVQRAIFKALELEMHPVKLNVVAIRGFNDDEILDIAQLAYAYPLHVRFIEFMPIGDLSFYSPEKFISIDEIRAKIEQKYELLKGKDIMGSGPAKYYNIVGGQGSVGLISPISHHFCDKCNRIRLTADGRLRSCLYDSKEIDLKLALLNCSNDEQLLKLFTKAIETKPGRHQMQEGWGTENRRKMFQIGG
ncbi:GTP 3',8-cyclase MoaA [Desulfosporosinus fructosivorans]